MNIPSSSHRNLGFLGFLGGLVFEAAAVLPFVAPEVTWVSFQHSLQLHLAAALLGGGGAAMLFAAGRGARQWYGPALLLALLAGLIPVVGLFAVLLLSLIIVSHHAQRPVETLELMEVPAPREVPLKRAPVHGPGPLPMPLVSLLQHLEPAALQQVVLGLESLPPLRTRPILHRLQKHSDVRVQLYANGLLNDQLDHLERRLATLKQRLAGNRNDEFSQIAIIETYAHLFRHNLVAPDEMTMMAGQALRETAAALALNPTHPVALQARVEFLLLLGQFREAGFAIEQLRPLVGQQKTAARLHARLLYDQAAAQPVAHPTHPQPPAAQQDRAVGQ